MSDAELGEEWHAAGSADDMEDEDVEQLWVGDVPIAVYRAAGTFYATQDVCTHEYALLSDGVVVDCVIECPFHQGRFDIRSGKALGAPVVVPLKTFPVKVVEGQIYVQVTAADIEALS